MPVNPQRQWKDCLLIQPWVKFPLSAVARRQAGKTNLLLGWWHTLMSLSVECGPFVIFVRLSLLYKQFCLIKALFVVRLTFLH